MGGVNVMALPNGALHAGMSYGDIARVLSSLGFEQAAGGKGSHTKWRHADGRVTVVPMNHKSRAATRKVINGVRKQIER